MDLNEILSFQPEKPSLKRLSTDDESDMRPPQAKHSRGAGGRNSEVDVISVSDEEKLRILKSLEEDGEEEEGEGGGLDASGVKRMLLSFEKKVPLCVCVFVCVCVCAYVCLCLCVCCVVCVCLCVTLICILCMCHVHIHSINVCTCTICVCT